MSSSSPSIKSSSAPAPNKPSPPLVHCLSNIRAGTDHLVALLRPTLLAANPPAKRILDQLQLSVSRALSLVDLEEGSSSAARRKAAPARLRLCRRRSSQPYSWRSISRTLEDGHTWRKYGQKEIQSSKHPRSYYRCTHKFDQGCKALRQVQLSEEDPSSFVITYVGEHTCRDPSSGLAAGQLPSSTGGSHLFISFPGGRTVVQEEEAAATPVPSSLKQESFDEEVMSNLSNDGCSSPGEFFTAAVRDGGGDQEVDDVGLTEDFSDWERLLGLDGGAGGCFW